MSSRPLSPFESIRGCEAYRASLSVNNYGVSMLEQGHFESAIMTFDDALAIMRQTITDDLMMMAAPSSYIHKPSLSYSLEPGKINAHDAMLQSAVVRLRAAQEPCHQNNGRRRPAGTLHIFPIEENDALSMRASIESGPTSSLCLPIRLRGLHQFESDTTTNISNTTSIPSALILRNHGLAHLLQYERQQQQQQQQHYPSGYTELSKRTSENDGYSNYHLEKAALSLSVSHSMLVQYRDDVVSCDRDNTIDTFDLIRALTLSALVLQNLYRVLLYMPNQNEQAQQVANALHCISRDVHDAQQVLMAMNVETDHDTTACAA
jgi:hypothetical protein